MVRRYQKISDDEIIALFAAGVFRLGEDGETVFGKNGAPLLISICWKGYSFVRLYHAGARRCIALHKLLWMLANGRPVPDGCELHHRKTKRHNRPEDIGLLTIADHDALHAQDEF